MQSREHELSWRALAMSGSDAPPPPRPDRDDDDDHDAPPPLREPPPPIPVPPAPTPPPMHVLGVRLGHVRGVRLGHVKWGMCATKRGIVHPTGRLPTNLVDRGPAWSQKQSARS